MIAIATPFRFSASGAVATTTDPDTIVSHQIRDVLVTAPRERCMRPSHTALTQTLIFNTADQRNMADVGLEGQIRCNEIIALCEVRSVVVTSESRPSDDGITSIEVLVVSASYSIPPDGGVRTTSFVIDGIITQETAG